MAAPRQTAWLDGIASQRRAADHPERGDQMGILEVERVEPVHEYPASIVRTNECNGGRFASSTSVARIGNVLVPSAQARTLHVLQASVEARGRS